ncbi:hypothetical protein M3Y94_00036800 [Aphelenchoides besseyi]|nr:hypothetical protein M3Y94_00036800 [Aphelenchoides besseyi]KAI6219057.1 hypothetical protein M3Y95_01126500 [Aphelenchoides besseyi]
MSHTGRLEATKTWEFLNVHSSWDSKYQEQRSDSFTVEFIPNVEFQLVIGNNKNIGKWFCVQSKVNGKVWGSKDTPKHLHAITWIDSSPSKIELKFKVVQAPWLVWLSDEALLIVKLKNELRKAKESLREVETNQQLQTKNANEKISKLTTSLSEAEEEREQLKVAKQELEETVREMKEENERVRKNLSIVTIDLSITRNVLAKKLSRTERECEVLKRENAMLKDENGELKDLMHKKDEDNQRKIDSFTAEMISLIACIDGMRLNMNDIKSKEQD